MKEKPQVDMLFAFSVGSFSFPLIESITININ